MTLVEGNLGPVEFRVAWVDLPHEASGSFSWSSEEGTVLGPGRDRGLCSLIARVGSRGRCPGPSGPPRPAFTLLLSQRRTRGRGQTVGMINRDQDSSVERTASMRQAFISIQRAV